MAEAHHRLSAAGFTGRFYLSHLPATLRRDFYTCLDHGGAAIVRTVTWPNTNTADVEVLVYL